jgi:TolB-like protein/Tfp pilus assembly protein PilF
MFTDIVGFTALTQENESATMRLLEEHRKLIRPSFASHGGREIKTIGDAFLVEFQSALDAVLCAAAIQQMMHDRKIARGEQLSLRVGIHVGDVVESGNDILGDAVNIASRIYPMAEPGGICISDEAYKQVRNKSEIPFVSLGEKSLKNVSTPVEVYRAVMPWEQHSQTREEKVLPRDRIAILPFANMSPDPNDEYFADGMTEEIISTVSGISGLNVISRTSVMHYKKTEKTLKDIGRELEVGSVLEGSFRKAGNRIRVTTQLIDVAADRHLWAQNYDRNLDDVFEVQSEVAKQVAEALKVRILSPELERIERKPTESTVAYSLYLKGRQHWNKRGLEDMRKASEYFELATHEDPTFALGYIGLADCYELIGRNWDVDKEPNHEKAKNLVAKALELDPSLAEAHATNGLVLMFEYRFREAEEELRRAIELKPSYAMAHMWYSALPTNQRRRDEAWKHFKKALELDPLSPIIQYNYGAWYLVRREYSSAIEPCRKAIQLGYTDASLNLAYAYGKMKMFEDMKRELATYVELDKGMVPLARLYADVHAAWLTDDKRTVALLLPELEARFNDEQGPSAYGISGWHFYIGEGNKGFEWLERSYAKKEFRLTSIQEDELFDGVRTDPRYLELLKRLGLD